MPEPKRTFYVAGRTRNAEMVSAVVSLLEEQGMEPTVDWTQVHVVLKPYAEHIEENREWADAFKAAVQDADVVILLGYDSPGARGVYIELGIALGAGVKQIIWATDLSKEDQSVFMCCTAVTLFDGTPGEFMRILPSLIA